MSREDNLAQTRDLLIAFGVLKKPKAKKKKSAAKAVSGASESLWHMAAGYPCRKCGKIENLYHLPFEDDETDPTLRAINKAIIERRTLEFSFNRGYQLTFRFKEEPSPCTQS